MYESLNKGLLHSSLTVLFHFINYFSNYKIFLGKTYNNFQIAGKNKSQRNGKCKLFNLNVTWNGYFWHLKLQLSKIKNTAAIRFFTEGVFSSASVTKLMFPDLRRSSFRPTCTFEQIIDELLKWSMLLKTVKV